MEYLTPSLVALVGAGFACIGLWLMALEARALRCRQRVAELERESVHWKRMVSYHGFIAGCWRQLMQGRPLTAEQQARLARGVVPEEVAGGV